MATAAATTHDPSLLGLSAELRNEIYRLALVETDPFRTEVTEKPPIDPPLLRTCRQIRHEAKEIFYHENSFHFVIHNCNASKFIKWSMSSKSRFETMRVKFVHVGPPNWQALKEWLRVFVEDGIGGPTTLIQQNDDDDDVEIRFFGLATDLVDNNEMSWKEILPILEHAHGIAAALDSDWE